MHNIGEIWNCAETWFSPIWSTRRKEAVKRITSNKKRTHFNYLDESKIVGQRVEKKQKKNLIWSLERCSWTFEVRMRTIQNLWYWRFFANYINKKIKTDNNLDANQHNEKNMFELFSSLQAHHFNIYVGANFSPFVSRQKKIVV